MRNCLKTNTLEARCKALPYNVTNAITDAIFGPFFAFFCIKVISAKTYTTDLTYGILLDFEATLYGGLSIMRKCLLTSTGDETDNNVRTETIASQETTRLGNGSGCRKAHMYTERLYCNFVNASSREITSCR